MDRRTFDELQNLDSIVELIDRGIITLVRSREIPFGIKAGPYVGSAILSDDFFLRIVEKSKGALKSLLAWSMPEDLREAVVAAPASYSGDVLPQIAKHFIDRLAYYLTHGRQKAYVRKNELSSIPNGRIDVGRTASLRSRGKFGMLSVDRFVITANILPNQLLAAALVVAEAIFRSASSGDSLTEALMLAPMFTDVSPRSVQAAEWSEKNALFDQVLQDPRTTHDLANALKYARPLVLHLGVQYENTDGALPRAYFLNLETLFEEAVRNLIASISETNDKTTCKGDQLKKALFVGVTDRYVADPDIVVSDARGAVVSIADCKYKEYPPMPDHGDVYQILAHASAFQSDVAVLVYPGDVADVRQVGSTSEKVNVIVAAVRPNNFETDVHQLAKTLKIIAPAPEAIAV